MPQGIERGEQVYIVMLRWDLYFSNVGYMRSLPSKRDRDTFDYQQLIGRLEHTLFISYIIENW